MQPSNAQSNQSQQGKRKRLAVVGVLLLLAVGTAVAFGGHGGHATWRERHPLATGPVHFPPMSEIAALSCLAMASFCFALSVVTALGLLANHLCCGARPTADGDAAEAARKRRRRRLCCLAIGAMLLVGSLCALTDRADTDDRFGCVRGEDGDVAPFDGTWSTADGALVNVDVKAGDIADRDGTLCPHPQAAGAAAVATKPSSTSSTGAVPADAPPADAPAAEAPPAANASCTALLDAAFRACRGDARADGDGGWYHREWWGGQYWFDADGGSGAGPRCSAPEAAADHHGWPASPPDASTLYLPGAYPYPPGAAVLFGAYVDGSACAAAMSAAVGRMHECGGDVLAVDAGLGFLEPSLPSLRQWNSFRGAVLPTWSAQLRMLDDENICACGGVVDGTARLWEVLTLGCGADFAVAALASLCFMCNVLVFGCAIHFALKRGAALHAQANGGMERGSRCVRALLAWPLAFLATVAFWTTGPLFLLAAGVTLYVLKKRLKRQAARASHQAVATQEELLEAAVPTAMVPTAASPGLKVATSAPVVTGTLVNDEVEAPAVPFIGAAPRSLP